MEYWVGDYDEFSSFENANVNNSNINNGGGVHFAVDDLLNFSKEDETMTDVFFDNLGANSAAVTPVDSCNSSVGDGSDGQFNGNVSCRSFNDCQFSGNELCVPYDDLAELEWLSNFVEESFSNEDLHFIPTTVTDSSSSITTTNCHAPVFPSDVSVPGKARSKRSRAAPCDWSSRLLVLKTAPSNKQREQTPNETPNRRCLHCASEKTPQWRTGPMGPKTLCNACGVRYKSGRLVPEYRPASSPTFVLAKHSNSHRKVIELRRQKEVQPQHPQLMGRGAMYNGCDEFMIHSRGGINNQDFRSDNGRAY